MQRSSSTLWVFSFALIALLWTPVRNFDISALRAPEPAPAQIVPAPTPSTDPEVEKVIAFCMDERHADSILCTVENPQTTEDLLPAVTEARNRYVRDGSMSDSDDETRIIERSTSTRVEQPTAKEPAPQPRSEDPINVPKIPKVELPEEIEVPEIDLPVVGNTGNLTDQIVTADSDD